MVDNKRIYSVGETVCGHPIADSSVYENHEPHNSFDNNGYLLGSAWSADDQQNDIVPTSDTISVSTSEVDSTVFKVPVKTPPISPKTKPILKSSGFGSSALGTAFGSSSQQQSNSKFVASSSTFIAPKSSPFGQFVEPKLNAGPTKDQIEAAEREKEKQRRIQEELERKIREEKERIRVLEEEKLRQIKIQKEREEQEKIRLKREAEEKVRLENERIEKIKRINSSAEEVLKDLSHEIIQEELQKTTQFEFNKYQQFIETVKNTQVSLQEEVLNDVLRKLVSEELEILKTQQSNILHKYFMLWLETTRRHKEQRRLIQELPKWDSKDPDEIAHPKQDETLDFMKRYRLGIPLDFNTNEAVRLTGKLDFNEIFAAQFSKQSPILRHGLVKHHRFYKLLLSIPEDREEKYGFKTFMNSWIRRNIEISEENDEGSLISEFRENVGFCCKRVQGINDPQIQKGHCNHFDGVLFVMTSENVLNSKKRLESLLLNTKNFKPVPLIIIVYNSSFSAEFLIQKLDLENFIKNEYISMFEIIGTGHTLKESDLIFAFDGCLKFLADNYVHFDDLEMQNLTSFISLALTEELYKRLEESWTSNQSLCSPKYITRLYNEAVDQTISIIDQDYSLYAEFPSELRKFVPAFESDIPGDFEQFPKSWKNSKRIVNLKSFLNKIKLSPITTEINSNKQNWIMEYSKQCLSTEDSEKVALGAIKILLETENEERFSWFPIIKHISIGVLNQVWSKMHTILPNEVIYPRNKFEEFLSQPWWLKLDWIKELKVKENAVQKEQIVPSLNDSQMFDEIFKRGRKTLRRADRKLKSLEDFSVTLKESSMNVSEAENSFMDESLYSFEVNSVLSKMEQKENSPPKCKKMKIQDEKLDFDSVIQRAMSISKRFDKRFDARNDF